MWLRSSIFCYREWWKFVAHCIYTLKYVLNLRMFVCCLSPGHLTHGEKSDICQSVKTYVFLTLYESGSLAQDGVNRQGSRRMHFCWNWSHICWAFVISATQTKNKTSRCPRTATWFLCATVYYSAMITADFENSAMIRYVIYLNKTKQIKKPTKSVMLKKKHIVLENTVLIKPIFKNPPWFFWA